MFGDWLLMCSGYLTLVGDPVAPVQLTLNAEPGVVKLAVEPDTAIRMQAVVETPILRIMME